MTLKIDPYRRTKFTTLLEKQTVITVVSV